MLPSRPRRNPSAGFALIVVAGILSTLVLVAVLFTQFVSAARAQAALRLRAVRDDLKSRSGQEYLAAFMNEQVSRSVKISVDGRLAGASGSNASSFQAEAQDTSGRIYVNDGYVDGSDRNANGVPDCRDLGQPSVFYGSLVGNGTGGSGPTGGSAEYRDSFVADGVVPRNRRLADLISALGDIVGALPNAGDRVVQSRPLGGYQTEDELALALGADWGKLKDFLTVEPRDKVSCWGGRIAPFALGSAVIAQRTPIRLAAAPPEVLQALTRGISYGTGADEPGVVGPKLLRTVQPREADAFAQAVQAHGPFASWLEFTTWLNANRGSLFLGGTTEQNWKANAVELNLNPEELETTGAPVFVNVPYPPIPVPFPDLFLPSWSWLTYDLDRGAVHANGDFRARRVSKLWDLRQVSLPPTGSIPGPLSEPFAYGPWGTGPVTLDDPVAGHRRGSVSFRSQADFENFGGTRALAEGVTLLGRPSRERMQTWPYFSLDSCPDYAADPGASAYYPSVMGSVRLMDRSAGPFGSEVFYLPCWEMGQPNRVPAVSSSCRENYQDAAQGAVPTFYPNPVSTFPPNLPRNFPGASGSRVGFEWGFGGANPGSFPLLGSEGAIQRGMFEFVGQNIFALLSQDNPMSLHAGMEAVDARDPAVARVFWQTPDDAFFSATTVSMPEPHHLAFAFDESGTLAIYLDGILSGIAGYTPRAANPTLRQHLEAGFLDEVRLFGYAASAPEIQAHALLGRFWGPDASGIPAVPSYTSPLVSFEAGAGITGVRWDGFVPKKIADATAAWNQANPDAAKAPLKVELLCYETSDGSGAVQVVSLPEELWQSGGGSADLRVRNVGSFRCRVWMDASAVDGFSNETPVFDSISVQYKLKR